MKRILLVAAFMICLPLSACSERTIANGSDYDTAPSGSSEILKVENDVSTPDANEVPSSSKSQEKPFDVEDTEKIALTESAELLTLALTQSTKGFSTNSDLESNHLRYPSTEDSNSINQFLYLLAGYQSGGSQHSLYANDIYQDSDGIYHLSAGGITTILQDVLGISTWDSSTSSFVYDPLTQEYRSGLEFGVGGGWKCGEILSSQIDLQQEKFIVEYKAEYLFPGASGESEETTSWLCRNIFSIGRKEDGQLYLSFVKTEIL